MIFKINMLTYFKYLSYLNYKMTKLHIDDRNILGKNKINQPELL